MEGDYLTAFHVIHLSSANVSFRVPLTLLLFILSVPFKLLISLTSSTYRAVLWSFSKGAVKNLKKRPKL